jgi:hypothetical protein
VTPACAVVLAGLCLQSPYDKATNLNAMYAFSDGTGVAQPDAVRRLSVRIEAYQSDNIRAQDPSGLPRACAGSACVAYLKTCSADGLQCEWDWGRAPGKDEPFGTLTVWIGATSIAAMAAAERAIAVEWEPSKGARLSVPLAALSERSSLAYLPPCTAVVQSGCANMFEGRVPMAKLTREQRLHLGD